MWLMFQFIFDDGERQFEDYFGLWIPSLVVYMPDRVAVVIRIRRNPVTDVYSESATIHARGPGRTIDNEIDMA